MELIIGGTAQGKLTYVLHTRRIDKKLVQNKVPTEAVDKTPVVINCFHLWVKERIANGGNPEAEIFSFLEQCPNCIIICDEIGNGIVPTDVFLRQYRERTGRLLTELAARAEKVERVICGIGQRIK